MARGKGKQWGGGTAEGRRPMKSEERKNGKTTKRGENGNVGTETMEKEK